jgi:hypothetical protein
VSRSLRTVDRQPVELDGGAASRLYKSMVGRSF